MGFTLGIIGGTGTGPLPLDEIHYEDDLLSLAAGSIGPMRVLYLPRQRGRPPHKVDHMQNIDTLRTAGAEAIVGITACGSLTRSIKPGDFVVPDDFIDCTQYPGSFINDEIIHPMTDPSLDLRLRNLLSREVLKMQSIIAKRAVILSIRGPRFSTPAEARAYAKQAELINMTTAPEANLCLEIEMPYAILGYVTDYDVGAGIGEPPVSYDLIKYRAELSRRALLLILRGISTDLA